MNGLKFFLFYLGNVVAISIPLALFEIWLERFKSGWGGEFYSPFWGRKFHINWIMRSMEKTYVSTYHLVMWVVVMPGILVAEYFLLAHAEGSRGWIMSFGEITLIPVIYLPAVWMGVSVIEDFLWFALNWHFPDAVERLFQGEMKWHTKYVHITSTKKLPRFYLLTPIWVIVLFILQFVLIKTSE